MSEIIECEYIDALRKYSNREVQEPEISDLKVKDEYISLLFSIFDWKRNASQSFLESYDWAEFSNTYMICLIFSHSFVFFKHYEVLELVMIL